jgi:hypothetical protein
MAGVIPAGQLNSTMKPRAHGGQPQRHPSSRGLPGRYSGPLQRTVPYYPPQSADTGHVGVQFNAYWAHAGRKPPSPVIRRQQQSQPPVTSLASNAVQAAGQDGTPTFNYSQAGLYGIQGGRGALTPVLSPGEYRFSANPVPGYQPTSMIGQSVSNGTQLSPVLGMGPFETGQEKRSLCITVAVSR